MQTWRLKIEGMTCSHCELKVDTILKTALPEAKIKVSYANSEAMVRSDLTNLPLKDLKLKLQEAGYTLAQHSKVETTEKSQSTLTFSFTQFAGILAVLGLLYLLIDRTVGFNAIPEVKPGSSLLILFGIGVLTSVHCISMCGGINLSQCIVTNIEPMKKATFLSKSKPSLLYNSGRIVSYTIIGGIVGALGSVISFSGHMKGIIAILTGAFMIIMGLNMLSIFPSLRKFNIKMPKIFAQYQSKIPAGSRPFYVGLLNGLMPCGPLQAMQLYALGTGSALMGALSMFAFSAGTVPLMFALGAISTVMSRKFTSLMLKISAVMVIFLGVVMAGRGFALGGTTVTPVVVDGWQVARIENGVQILDTKLLSNEYPAIMIQKGIPVEWHIEADEENLNGCNNRINLYEYDQLNMPLGIGDNIFKFTPDQTGTFGYSCWMGMIGGQIKVVDDLSAVDQSFIENEKTFVPENQPTTGGCCAP